MKKFSYLFIIVFTFALFSCATTSSNPSEIEYKEITAEQYFNTNLADLYSSAKGYKISDVFIQGADKKINNGNTEVILTLASEKNAWGHDVYATDFFKNIAVTDPTWEDRVDAVANNQKYNGHYTVYVYGKIEVGFKNVTQKVTAFNIEGVPSQEEIDADKAAAEAERIAKEEAEKKAREEKNAKLNATGKALANGYTYHGIEDVEKNRKLFVNGALESGHAYYISGFVVKYGGSMAKIEYGDGLFFSSQSNAVYVDYVNQKVKGEVVEAGIIDFFGKKIEKPLEVVVAGGNGYSKTPIILGIIEEK